MKMHRERRRAGRASSGDLVSSPPPHRDEEAAGTAPTKIAPTTIRNAGSTVDRHVGPRIGPAAAMASDGRRYVRVGTKSTLSSSLPPASAGIIAESARNGA